MGTDNSGMLITSQNERTIADQHTIDGNLKGLKTHDTDPGKVGNAYPAI